MVSRLTIEYKLRYNPTALSLLRELGFEEVREIVFRYLASHHMSRKSFARELHISESGLRAFLRYVPPGPHEWHALTRWSARRQRKQTSPAVVGANLLAVHAPPRQIYQTRIEIINFVRDLYLSAGWNDEFVSLDLW